MLLKTLTFWMNYLDFLLQYLQTAEIFYAQENPEEPHPLLTLDEYPLLEPPVEIIGAESNRSDLFSPHFGHIISSSGVSLVKTNSSNTSSQFLQR